MAGASLAFPGRLLPATLQADGSASPHAVLFPILERSRWGFIDRSGRVRISPRFETILAVADGFARGKPDEIFMAPSVAPDTNAIVAVRSGGRWGFVDHEDRLLPPRFDQVGAFREGLAPVRQGELWGFVGASGSLDVPVRFTHAGNFVGGVAIVGQDFRYGVIDREGRFVVRARFESIRPADSVFHDNRALVTQFDKKGYVSRAGTIAVPAMFDAASPFSEGLAAVTRRGQTGYIDTTGRWVIAPRWWTAERFSRGRAVVIVNSEYGYIDRGGVYVAIPQFTDARAFTSDDRAEAWKGPTRGVVDLSGRWSVSRMDELQRLDDTLSVAVISGRKGLVRRATKEMIAEYPWEELGLFHEGLAHVGGSDGRLGFVDLDGRVVIPPRFRRVGRFDHGLCKATTRDTLGYIDRSGAWVWSNRFR